MAWIKTMYGNVVVAPISKFVCDTEDDVTDLPTNVVMGSEAIIISSGNVYLMGSTGIWAIPGGV